MAADNNSRGQRLREKYDYLLHTTGDSFEDSISHGSIARTKRSVVLRNGVSFEVAGDGGPQSDFVQKLRKTDRIEACFGPTRKWADEGPNVRPALVVNDETKDFIFTFGEPPAKPGR